MPPGAEHTCVDKPHSGNRALSCVIAIGSIGCSAVLFISPYLEADIH
jgi:hypothetical protein